MEELKEAMKRWDKLSQPAENNRDRTKRVVEVEVAEVLEVGMFMFMLPDVAIIRDQNGLVWEVPETRTKNGLVSRWNVRPGMKLRLEMDGSGTTRAYPLTPEV